MKVLFKHLFSVMALLSAGNAMALEVVATDPADGSYIKAGWTTKSFTITFDQRVEKIISTPDVKFTQTLNGVVTNLTPDECWMITMQNGSTVAQVWGSDMDYYTEDFKAVDGAVYSVVFPAGTLKGADGIKNSEISFSFTCGEEPAVAVGEKVVESPFTYVVLEGNKLELTEAEKQSEYVIPATVSINGKDFAVSSIAERVFRWSSATKVEIGANVETIGASAFASSDVASFTFAADSKLETIGDNAFSSTKMTTLALPASVKNIGASAFFTCRNLESISLPEGLESIGGSAFYRCDKLTAITLPSTLQELGAKAFLFCSGLQEVVVPEGVTALGDGVFNGCTSLQNVILPSTIETIGDEAFLDCTSLTSLTIPAAVRYVGSGIIARSGVSSLTVAEGNENFVVEDGCLYVMQVHMGDEVNKTPYFLLVSAVQKGLTEVTVHDDCIAVHNGAFWGSDVCKVVLPSSCNLISAYAFCQSSLAEINLGDHVNYVGEQAFAGTQLTSIVIPASVESLYDGVFAGCEHLTTVRIPASVKMIYNHAFHGCTSLTDVYAEGEEAPEFDEVWETYDAPFYNIPSNATLHVLAGCSDSYKAAGWDEYFRIVEDNVLTSLQGIHASGEAAQYDLMGRRTKEHGLMVRDGQLQFVR